MATVPLSERCYAMDVRHPLLVVATADRNIHVFDMRKPQQPYKTLLSNLKFQTRTIACFPNQAGFAIGSIEGRCAIQHIEEKDKKDDFAFKCHRDGSDIYPVSSLAFHPFGTFSTTGGDGTFCFWDKDARQKLKAFSKMYVQGSCDNEINVLYCSNQAITVGKFNAPGDIFAYACSYDWAKGADNYNPAQQPSVIRLHAVTEAEIKQRKKGNIGRSSV